jgi:hypothetical protein
METTLDGLVESSPATSLTQPEEDSVNLSPIMQEALDRVNAAIDEANRRGVPLHEIIPVH